MSNKTIYKTENERQLAEAGIGNLFCKFAIPGAVGLLFVGMQSIIDGLIVGNYLGANALAAISLILPSYSLITAMSIIIGIGSQTLVSIGLGEKNYRKSKDAMTTGVIALFCFCSLFSIGALLFVEEVATLLGSTPLLIGYSTDYMYGLFPFMPIIGVMFYCDYMLKATGHPRFAMMVMSMSVLLNIALTIIFVSKCSMGILGAALATGIAFSIGAICSLVILLNKRHLISLLSGRFRWNMLWKMAYNGSSEGVSELSAGVSILLFNITFMNHLGEAGVAAFTVINYISLVGIMLFLGIADGIIPIVSYNYGAGNWNRILGVVKLAAKSNLLIGVLLFTILVAFAEPIIEQFVGGESNVTQIASYGASIYAISFLMVGVNILASSYFTALTNAKISIVISLLRGFIFIALGLMILPTFFGIDGVWLTIPVAELLTLIISIILFRRSIPTTTM